MNRLTEHFFLSSTGVFTQSDVAVAFDGTDFSRHGLVKRAIANGEILNIRRGLYCLAPKYQKRPVTVFGIAERLYGPSYISLETALSYHGWIPEAVYACTCASFANGRDFNTPLGLFSYRRIPQKTFYLAVDRRIDDNGNTLFMASPAKALADYLYVHRLTWQSIREPLESLRIDEDGLLGVTSEELQDLMDNYTSGRVKRFLAAWLTEVMR